MGRRRPGVVVDARVAAARDAFVVALDEYLRAVLEERAPVTAIVSATQAAELLGVHHSKVYDLVRQGLLVPLQGFAEVRLSRDQVLAYAAGADVGPAGSALQLRTVG